MIAQLMMTTDQLKYLHLQCTIFEKTTYLAPSEIECAPVSPCHSGEALGSAGHGTCWRCFFRMPFKHRRGNL